MKNVIISLVLVGLIAGIVGAYYFPTQKVTVGSPTGSTIFTPTFSGIIMAPASGTATTTSVLNNSGSTRYVMGVKVGCGGVGTSKTAYTGAGLANLLLTVATSSTANPATLNPVFQVAQITVATSAPLFDFASATPQTATTTYATAWNTGEYMSFSFNATNTAACTVGVDYIQG